MVSWPNTLLHGRGAAVGLAFYNVLGAIGGFVSPYVVGRLSNGGSYNSSMYVQGAFNLAAALMVLGAQSACMAIHAMSVGGPQLDAHCHLPKSVRTFAVVMSVRASRP